MEFSSIFFQILGKFWAKMPKNAKNEPKIEEVAIFEPVSTEIDRVLGKSESVVLFSNTNRRLYQKKKKSYRATQMVPKNIRFYLTIAIFPMTRRFHLFLEIL